MSVTPFSIPAQDVVLPFGDQCHVTLFKPAEPLSQMSLPLFTSKVPAGFPSPANDYIEKNLDLNELMIQNPAATFFARAQGYPTEAGTPQGGICSPVLANLTLDGLERALKTAFPKPSHGQAPLVNLVRYTDDFIITGRTKELLEQEVKPFVERFLAERGLVLSVEKTHITSIDAGFDFLGHNIRKYRGKLLIKPAQRNVRTFLNKVRALIKANKATSAGDLIAYLNPLIRGWANYYRHVVSARIFSRVDSAVFHCLWRWALRRHPNRSKRWIRRKYFGTRQNDHWVFQGYSLRRDGATIKATLPPRSAITFSKYGYYCLKEQRFLVIFANMTSSILVNPEMCSYYRHGAIGA